MAMPNLYRVQNGAVPTTAATAAVATGTAIKTLLQVTAPSTRELSIVEWGISFDGAPNAIRCELIETTTVAGTGATAVTPTALSDFNGPATLATAGFSPTAEGTVVATTRPFDVQTLSTNTYVKQFPLGYEPNVGNSNVVRVRVTAAATVNAVCYIVYHEG